MASYSQRMTVISLEMTTVCEDVTDCCCCDRPDVGRDETSVDARNESLHQGHVEYCRVHYYVTLHNNLHAQICLLLPGKFTSFFSDPICHILEPDESIQRGHQGPKLFGTHIIGSKIGDIAQIILPGPWPGNNLGCGPRTDGSEYSGPLVYYELFLSLSKR